MKVILIEGPVGAGKSTLLQGLNDCVPSIEQFKNKNILFVDEPLDVITQCENLNALTVLQSNPGKAAMVQVHIVQDLCKYYKGLFP